MSPVCRSTDSSSYVIKWIIGEVNDVHEDITTLNN